VPEAILSINSALVIYIPPLHKKELVRKNE